MGTERVSKLMRQYAIPCIISLLVGALYNIVDQIFIANASYLGSYGNAANTVVALLTSGRPAFQQHVKRAEGSDTTPRLAHTERP